MYISQITLRDWKAYTTASFDLPAPGRDKNIVLIGAPNGYGKTSLFEAIVLGMFGRDGLPLIARSPFSGVIRNASPHPTRTSSRKHSTEVRRRLGAILAL